MDGPSSRSSAVARRRRAGYFIASSAVVLASMLAPLPSYSGLNCRDVSIFVFTFSIDSNTFKARPDMRLDLTRWRKSLCGNSCPPFGFALLPLFLPPDRFVAAEPKRGGHSHYGHLGKEGRTRIARESRRNKSHLFLSIHRRLRVLGSFSGPRSAELSLVA